MASRVLLVEDDDDLRESMEVLMRRRGIEVSAARDGQEALDELQTAEPPALMLLDLMMPEVNGWAVRAHMLADAELARIPVVLLSGVADVADQGKALQAQGVLEKPVRPRDLYDVVESYCHPTAPPRGADRRRESKEGGPLPHRARR